MPQTFLWLSVNSSLGYEEKEEDKEEWAHRAGKWGTDEARKGDSGGATEEEEGSEDSRLAAPPPTVLGEGDTPQPPPKPH